ncbi:MAG TPA: FkbM family methyltransferase [Terriglobales bacterium]|nr:FkbM family methyltransferase [Terriglobales bacterium]
MSLFRSFVRRTVRKFQLESSPFIQRLRRYYPGPSEHNDLRSMLDLNQISIVLDVGANAGQFARSLRMAGYTGRIVSFEPMSALHNRLVRLARNDSTWIIAPAKAIGDSNGQLELKISADTVSSSLLEMLPAHIQAEPDSRYVGTETVKVERLDSAAAEFLKSTDRIFVKIDVQGYEEQVLMGAPELLKRASGLMLELCLVPCYKDQMLFESMLNRLTSLGFEMWNLYRGTRDPQSARLLQVDAVFFRII